MLLPCRKMLLQSFCFCFLCIYPYIVSLPYSTKHYTILQKHATAIYHRNVEETKYFIAREIVAERERGRAHTHFHYATIFHANYFSGRAFRYIAAISQQRYADVISQLPHATLQCFSVIYIFA